MTWSVVDRDPGTGCLGIAAATRFFAAGGWRRMSAAQTVLHWLPTAFRLLSHTAEPASVQEE